VAAMTFVHTQIICMLLDCGVICGKPSVASAKPQVLLLHHPAIAAALPASSSTAAALGLVQSSVG
jgi:hypothetical protein